MKIAVIGGGAAGFFGAIHAAEANPQAVVVLFEKSNKLLAKLRISGGGRCNVTHACNDNSLLVKSYPRGERELRGPFERFSVKDTIAWFRKRGVQLKTEADGRMFPVTDDSETIAQCLERAAKEAGVKILMQTGVDAITPVPGQGFLLRTGKAELSYDKVLVGTGGGPKISGFDWLAELGHSIVPPVPSLFTFNLEKHPLKELMGVAVNPAEIKIEGSKLQSTGPLLITHWGLSGPAVLRLSAWGARELNEKDYSFNALVNWEPGKREEELQKLLMELRKEHPKKLPANTNTFAFPNRMWEWLVNRAGINPELRWADISNKDINKLAAILHRTVLPVRGKSTYKEEFVTAGGIALRDVDMKTMESRKCPGLYFAGEVLDIDGITGGFNFQAAWTTGYIAGRNMGLGELKIED